MQWVDHTMEGDIATERPAYPLYCHPEHKWGYLVPIEAVGEAEIGICEVSRTWGRQQTKAPPVVCVDLDHQTLRKLAAAEPKGRVLAGRIYDARGQCKLLKKGC